jgi:predicted GIY-YIG superfamily endonuclease
MLACQITPKDNDITLKGWQDVFYIYCGGTWPSKQRLLEHQHKGYNKAPFYPNSSKHVQLSMYPNFKSIQKTKQLKHVLTNEKSTSHLRIKNQAKIDE